MDFLKDMQNTMNLNYAYLHPKKKKKVQSQKPGWYLPCRAYAAIGTGIKQVNKYTNSNCDKC